MKLACLNIAKTYIIVRQTLFFLDFALVDILIDWVLVVIVIFEIYLVIGFLLEVELLPVQSHDDLVHW